MAKPNVPNIRIVESNDVFGLGGTLGTVGIAVEKLEMLLSKNVASEALTSEVLLIFRVGSVQ